MPHVTLESSDISLFYRSNFSKFNPSKATVLLLHGTFFSVDFLSPQMEDERLAGKYNLIGFDQLSCGQTINPVLDGSKDAYVEAAAIMVALDKLGLRGEAVPFHIFASQAISQQIALRIAELWPERVLSLFFCGVGGPEEEMLWFPDVFQMWGFATCQGDLEGAIAGMVDYAFGDDDRLATVEEKDEAVAYWLTALPPNQRAKLWYIGTGFTQEPLNDEALKAIDKPTMVLHGDAHAVYPMTVAESFCRQLGGSPKLKIVPNGPDALSFQRHFASKFVNPLFVEFVRSVEGDDDHEATDGVGAGRRSRSATVSSLSAPVKEGDAEDEETFIKDGLERVAAKFPGEPASTRKGVWAFSRVGKEKAEELEAKLREITIDQANAFSPEMDARTGRPMHKWSERNLGDLIEPTSPLNGFGFANGNSVEVDDGGLRSPVIAGLGRRPSADWTKVTATMEEHTTTTSTTTTTTTTTGTTQWESGYDTEPEE